jgi:hypothetical protein
MHLHTFGNFFDFLAQLYIDYIYIWTLPFVVESLAVNVVDQLVYWGEMVTASAKQHALTQLVSLVALRRPLLLLGREWRP